MKDLHNHNLNLHSTEEKPSSDNIKAEENTTAQDVAANSKTEEKLFTQSQLESLISERIKRERKVNEALIPIKNLLSGMAKEGLIKGASYEEIADNLMTVLKKSSQTDDGVCENTGEEKQSLENVKKLQNDMETKGEASPGDAKESVAAEDGASQIRMTQSGDGGSCISNQSQEAGGMKMEIGDFCALKEKYPGVDMNKLFEGSMFEKFSSGKNKSITEIYDDFCAFLSEFFCDGGQHYAGTNEMEADEGRIGHAFSTAFSSGSGTSDRYSDGLTKQQMEIAKSAGLSYREYAQLLSSIPKNPKREIN